MADVPPREDELDAALRGVLRELITYLIEHPRTISSCLDVVFVGKSLERIGALPLQKGNRPGRTGLRAGNLPVTAAHYTANSFRRNARSPSARR